MYCWPIRSPTQDKLSFGTNQQTPPPATSFLISFRKGRGTRNILPRPCIHVTLLTSFGVGLVKCQSPLGSSQLASEKKPRLSGSNESLLMSLVAFCLR
jgi:hypothetical protein